MRHSLKAMTLALLVTGCGELTLQPDAVFHSQDTTPPAHVVETFQHYDFNHDGYLTLDEFMPDVAAIIMRAEQEGRKLSRSRLKREMDSYRNDFLSKDQDRDGQLSLGEFNG